jgi:hypothetical protein
MRAEKQLATGTEASAHVGPGATAVAAVSRGQSWCQCSCHVSHPFRRSGRPLAVLPGVAISSVSVQVLHQMLILPRRLPSGLLCGQTHSPVVTVKHEDCFPMSILARMWTKSWCVSLYAQCSRRRMPRAPACLTCARRCGEITCKRVLGRPRPALPSHRKDVRGHRHPNEQDRQHSRARQDWQRLWHCRPESGHIGH